ncbi:MAG: FTR1 family protein, partial [Nitrosarchaeum sp.]|nr:FTR1 family protein [Nitrosarchaeum sp.]
IEDSILPDLTKAEDMTSKLTPVIDVSPTSEKVLKSMGDASEDQKSGVKNEIDVIRERLEETLLHYSRGDPQSAHASARSAYLDSYEFVEIPLRAIDPDFTLEVEYQFATLRNLIKQEAPKEEIQDAIIGIRRNLDESEIIVSGIGTLAPSIAFTSSFAIIFREGLESVLILGAITTYLEASRNSQFKKYIYYGVIAAFAATTVTWIVASYIIEISGANRELIEAIAALSATAVLFYVSFWVLNKIEHKKWMEFVKAKVWQATATGSVMVFVMLSFFTVYREGFETVLFYQAMSGFAKYMELYVGLGFVIGMISLLGLYFVMRKLGRKLPLRALFGLTMGVGAYLSIAFLGNAIRELQIIEIVPYTGLIGIIPRLDINLAMMTGIYPTLETIVAQIILLGVYLVASSYILILRPRKELQLVSMRKSRNISDE